MANFQIYNGAMSAEQVADLANTAPVPEPSACAFVGIRSIEMPIVLRWRKTA